MKNMIKGILILFLLNLVSCNNFIDLNDFHESVTQVVFVEENNNSRAVTPYFGYDKERLTNLEMKAYKLNLESNLYELVLSKTYSSINLLLNDKITIEPGDWEFKFTAQQEGLPNLEGFTFITIEKNIKNTVLVTLRPYTKDNFVYNAYVPTSLNVKLSSVFIWNGQASVSLSNIESEVISSGEYADYTKYSFSSNLEPSTYWLSMTFTNNSGSAAGNYYDTIIIANNNLSIGNVKIDSLESEVNYASITLKYPVNPDINNNEWETKTISNVIGKRIILPTECPYTGFVVEKWFDNPNYTGSVVSSVIIQSENDNIYYAKCTPLSLSSVELADNLFLDKTFTPEVLNYTIFERTESNEQVISLLPILLNSNTTKLDKVNYQFEKLDGNSIEVKVINKDDENLFRTYSFTYSKRNTVAYYASIVNDYPAGEYTIVPMYSSSDNEYVKLINSIHNNQNIIVNLDLSKVTGIENIKNCFSTYPEIKNIKSIILPSSTKKLCQMAFYNWTGLTKIVFPDSLEEIEYSVFTNDVNLHGDVYVSKKLQTIASFAGANFDTLTVSDENPNYSSYNGILLSKDKKKALALVGQKEFENANGIIPTSVEEISYNCFSYSNISKVTLPTTLKEIGMSAFYQCKNLESIVIPYSVTKIGQMAFAQCTSMKYADLSQSSILETGDSQFSGNTALLTLKLPNGIKKIGASLCMSCSNLETIEIPPTVTEIGNYAFFGCNKISFDNSSLSNLISIGDYAFFRTNISGELRLSNNLTYLGSWAFSQCENISKITFGNSISEIKDHTFYYCKGLVGDLVIPDNITAIGESAFESCSNLDGNLYLSKNLTTIGAASFEYCENLKGEIIIPDSVETIGKRAFYRCKSFSGSLIIPNKIKKIEEYTFTNCSNIESVSFGSSIISIGYEAFEYCAGILSITVPENVVFISRYAFDGCTSMKNAYFENKNWFYSAKEGATSGTNIDLTNSLTAAQYLSNTYDSYYWYSK